MIICRNVWRSRLEEKCEICGADVTHLVIVRESHLLRDVWAYFFVCDKHVGLVSRKTLKEIKIVRDSVSFKEDC